jgi:hypothetical protein
VLFEHKGALYAFAAITKRNGMGRPVRRWIIVILRRCRPAG